MASVTRSRGKKAAATATKTPTKKPAGGTIATQPNLDGAKLNESRFSLDTPRRVWCPSYTEALRLIAASRLIASVYANISDCDEVFNYWEPTHYLQYGTGFQTWEYAPQYAIRSWAYLVLHAILAGTFEFGFAKSKIQVFYLARAVLSLASSSTEAFLYNAIATHVHPRVANYTLIFLIFSPGMFTASPSFLPSTFAMVASTWAFALMLESPASTWRTRGVAVASAVAAVWGWPFAAVLIVPFVVEEVLASNRIQRIWWLIQAGLIAIVLVLAPLVVIDQWFYKSWIIAPLNIVLYNVFGGKELGPEIYGAEPWYFYILNGLLNFNVAFLAAIASLPMLIGNFIITPSLVKENTSKATASAIQLAMRLIPTYLWLAIFSFQPHKEERFIFVVYPQLCFCAAVAMYFARGTLEMCLLNIPSMRQYTTLVVQRAVFVVLGVFIGVSVLRVYSGYMHYHAPQDVYVHLSNVPTLAPESSKLYTDGASHNTTTIAPSTSITGVVNVTIPVAEHLRREAVVCVGKEWHRFPSHYFLPTGMRLKFLRSSFRGQLPRHFAQDSVASAALAQALSDGQFIRYAHDQRRQPRSFATPIHNVNNVNAEEPDRYVPLHTCDYLVDTVPADKTGLTYNPTNDEPWYALDTASWSRVVCVPFLDAKQSSMAYRTLGLPFGPRAWMDYCLLVRRRAPIQ